MKLETVDSLRKMAENLYAKIPEKDRKRIVDRYVEIMVELNDSIKDTLDSLQAQLIEIYSLSGKSALEASTQASIAAQVIREINVVIMNNARETEPIAARVAFVRGFLDVLQHDLHSVVEAYDLAVTRPS